MAKLIVYAISDNDSIAVENIAIKAMEASGREASVRAFSNVSTQLELERILLSAVNQPGDPLVFYTMESPVLFNYLKNFCDLHKISYLDLLTPAVVAVQNKLLSNGDETFGALRKLDDAFFRRVDAMDFAIRYDDGKDAKGIMVADIVIIGVSRTSKTPLSVFLANQNRRVINIPLIPGTEPPKELFEVSPSKVFGLTSAPSKLEAVRTERLKALGLPTNSEYASRDRIMEEIAYAQGIMKRIGCAIIDVSSRSIEETADVIIRHLKS